MTLLLNVMEEEYKDEDLDLLEELAQSKYENKRLKDENISLKRSICDFDEELSSFTAEMKKRESDLKRSEQQLVQNIKEKTSYIDTLEKKVEETIEKHKRLSLRLSEEEGEKNKLAEKCKMLQISLKELTDEKNQVEMVNSNIINLITEEYGLIIVKLSSLKNQVKVLDDEIRAVRTKLETLLFEHLENCNLLPKNYSALLDLNSELDSQSLLFVLETHEALETPVNECNNLSLEDEIRLAEAEENININNNNEEEKLNEMSLSGMLGFLSDALPESNATSSRSCNRRNMGCKSLTMTDGQAGECHPLAEAPDSVEVKEAIVNLQPVTNQTVESISTATQTDRFLLAKAFEELSPIRNVLDHKYHDIDMDLYRSYRKLSILPEEEDDETFKRIPSLKNTIKTKAFSAKLPDSYKTHSADDILQYDQRLYKSQPSHKVLSSCTNIILSDGECNPIDSLIQGSSKIRNDPDNDSSVICDKILSDSINFKSEKNSLNAFHETHSTVLNRVETLRQPLSFDSYLDTKKLHFGTLQRQLSDPIQGTVFDKQIDRCGNYLKRPRSTCRPLRLPCEGGEIKPEERIAKVRFDLSDNTNTKLNGSKNSCKAQIVHISNLKDNRKLEKVSRFTVERVDEDEFRKSIEDSYKIVNRKRPPLIHSVVYKKSVLQEITRYDMDSNEWPADTITSKLNVTGSPDSQSYETATESSPVDSIDISNYESNYLIADIYPCKRRKQSDSSSYSIDSQDSADGNDIFLKSIKLHSDSEHITMKELDMESSTSSHLSMDMDIPYIDAEELPVIKLSPELMKRSFSIADDEKNEKAYVKESFSNETFATAYSDVMPSSSPDVLESSLSPPKSGLSKSPTVLRNLSNFELFSIITESAAGSNKIKRDNILVQNHIAEEELGVMNGINSSQDHSSTDRAEEDEESTILKLTSPDVSEISDNVTYVTVKSDASTVPLSSDCDSDTYVTIHSDKSTLERKFSDLSENSSSPYNTPPDTSSASFCTPPDTYSPILTRLVNHFGAALEGDSTLSETQISPSRNNERKSSLKCEKHAILPLPNSTSYPTALNNSSIPTLEQGIENEHISSIYTIDDLSFSSQRNEFNERKEMVIFDTPKLEFYETNDSKENLEAFLKTEEGLQELVKTPLVSDRSWRFSNLEDLQEEPAFVDSGGERKYSDTEEGSLRESLAKNGGLDSPGDAKFYEKRSKRHPPLSRQNSTEEYNFLEPHDSSLNLSEEISSPSTTPDTSNKTVIFKSKPLTVSNTIDLEDDDFPISESEMQINFNGSETEIVEISVAERTAAPIERYDIYSCRSEPCIPSISSSADIPTIIRLPKQSSSVTEHESDRINSFRSDAPGMSGPPEIIVSNLSSESENDSDGLDWLIGDFSSNASERSEVNMSDVDSLSNISPNSDVSEKLPLERSPEIQKTDCGVPLSASPVPSNNSSSSLNKVLSVDMEMEDHHHSITTATDIEKESGIIEERFVVMPQYQPDIGQTTVDNLNLYDIPDASNQRRNYHTGEASARPRYTCYELCCTYVMAIPINEIEGNKGLSKADGSSSILPCETETNKAEKSSWSGISPHSIASPVPYNILNQTSTNEMTYVQDFNNGHIFVNENDGSHNVNENEDTSIGRDEEVALGVENGSNIFLPWMSVSFDNRMRYFSATQQTLNTIHSLRNIIKWFSILLEVRRFQFPENIHQLALFFITLNVFVIITSTCICGFLIGFNETTSTEYSQTMQAAIMLAECLDNSNALATMKDKLLYSSACGFFIFAVTILKFLPNSKILKFVFQIALLVFLNIISYTLHVEGLVGVCERLGLRFKAYYPGDAPL